MSPARSVAHRVLERVEDGAWASEVLLRDSASLDARDAGLASEIVYGCLRRQLQLDWLIDSHTGSKKLDRVVRIALRMGVYQLRHLGRVPPHAAVSESVELVRKARKSSAAGLVNAVLRRVDRGEVHWPSRDLELSMPNWLLTGWDRQFGAETSNRIAMEFLKPPNVWVRNPPPDRTDLVLEPGEVPGSFRVISGHIKGLRVQDVGSQSVVPLLDLEAGLSFLDLCSAPGNKTAQALESGVRAVACDLHWSRLKNSNGVCPRVVLDARQPLPFRGRFDRILADVPCSGTGTLGRNPEIRWRLQPADLEDLHQRQVAILRRGLEYLAPGGRMVYSTCSLEKRENEDVVESVRGIRVVKMFRRTPGQEPGDGFFAAAITSE